MRVIEVRRKGNNIYVLFENDENLIVPYELFVNNYLVKNDSLSDKQFSEYKNKVEIYKIKQSSFRYLSGRNHSRFELKGKLLKKKYSKLFIDQVLDDLEKQQLLNDLDFARGYFLQQQKKKKGLLKIKANLFQKGVDREIVDKVVANLADDDVFLTQAEQLVEKKIKSLKFKDLPSIKMKQKLYQYLASKGFTSDIISEVLNKIDLKKEL